MLGCSCWAIDAGGENRYSAARTRGPDLKSTSIILSRSRERAYYGNEIAEPVVSDVAVVEVTQSPPELEMLNLRRIDGVWQAEGLDLAALPESPEEAGPTPTAAADAGPTPEPHDAVRPAGQSNVLQAVCTDEALSFIVNGEELLTVDHPTGDAEGDVGFFLHSAPVIPSKSSMTMSSTRNRRISRTGRLGLDAR